MIHEERGRARSYRTHEETLALLRQDFKALSPEEREALILALREFQQTEAPLGGAAAPEPGTRLFDVMSDVEWEREPVDLETFVRDEYYLGKTCDNLYPKLLEDLKDLFSGGYHEAIFTGSIGWGKTFLASIGVCRVLYELSCMKDPQRSYGLAAGSIIAIVCFSVNELLAMKVVFENITNKLQASPYFKEHFQYEITKKEMRFNSKKVWLAARASTDASALGLNTIGALLDEGNFMPEAPKSANKRFGVEIQGRASAIYNGIKRRMKSRFMRAGQLPGMLFIVSSKKTKDDFTAKLISKSKTDASVFVRDYAQWDVKPDAYWSAKKFTVLCGNEGTPSKILTEDEAVTLRATAPEDVVFIDVPDEYRPDFEADLEGAIRDIAGISTVAMSPFIQQRDKIKECVDSRLVHPFQTLVHDPSTTATFEWSRMARETITRHGERQWVPLLNPKAPRHVHIDLALRSDAVGFVMAHQAGWKDVIRRRDGRQYTERVPVFIMDLALQVQPPTGGEIDLGDVRQLVYALSAHGFRISKVTLDSYQSADTIQQLKKKGYKAELLSIDRTMEPYEHLKLVIYEGRLRMYDYPPLMVELQQLERDYAKNKVDHPATGSKDTSDALAGTLFTLSQSRGADALPILPSLAYSPGETWPSAAGGGAGRGDALPMLVGGGWSPGDDWTDL